MKPLLLLFLALTFPADTLSIKGQFLKRGDLPDDFKFPLLELGFAVLRVKVENGSQEMWSLRPSDMSVLNPKGKVIKKVTPFDITPKIMRSKAFKRRFREFHVEDHGPYGYPGTSPGVYGRNVRTIDMTSPGDAGPVVLSADTAVKLRSILEKHEIKETTLIEGETIEALIYLKSKKHPSELSGSTLVIGKTLKVKIP